MLPFREGNAPKISLLLYPQPPYSDTLIWLLTFQNHVMDPLHGRYFDTQHNSTFLLLVNERQNNSQVRE